VFNTPNFENDAVDVHDYSPILVPFGRKVIKELINIPHPVTEGKQLIPIDFNVLNGLNLMKIKEKLEKLAEIQ
jgi:hypothetical protein